MSKELKAVPLEQVSRRLRKARRHDVDYYIHLGKVRLVPGASPLELHERLALRVATDRGVMDLRFRPRSILQVLSHLDVPATFVNRIPVDLAMEVINRLLDDRAEELVLLRVGGPRGDEVRALLKSSFSRFSDRAALDIAMKVCSQRELMATNVAVLADSFLLRLVDPSQPLNVAPGSGRDLVYTGVDLYNSETGHGKLRVQPVLFRLVCSNGMGITEDLGGGLTVRLDRIDGDQVLRRFEQSLAYSANKAHGLGQCYRATHGQRLQDPDGALAAFMSAYGLGSANGRIGQLIRQQLEGRNGLFGVTKFDLIQAVTEVSKGMAVRQRLRFEDAAGAYMMMLA